MEPSRIRSLGGVAPLPNAEDGTIIGKPIAIGAPSIALFSSSRLFMKISLRLSTAVRRLLPRGVLLVASERTGTPGGRLLKGQLHGQLRIPRGIRHPRNDPERLRSAEARRRR